MGKEGFSLGLILCSLVISCKGDAVPDSERNLYCYSCEPDVPNHPKCSDKSNDAVKVVGFCYQCFIQQTWFKGEFVAERRGCLGGNEYEPHNELASCTYHYPIDGDYGYGEDDDDVEVQEVCRCRGATLCNGGNITSLGGKGDIRNFPPTSTIKSIRPGDGGAQRQGPGWGYSKVWIISGGNILGIIIKMMYEKLVYLQLDEM